jgi:hypothetical protein|tara:strand:- start:1154 stop:1342 length:189 start_codon:yes stop_codon:yes gene_type:complete
LAYLLYAESVFDPNYFAALHQADDFYSAELGSKLWELSVPLCSKVLAEDYQTENEDLEMDTA